jgi:hypothetical protein
MDEDHDGMLNPLLAFFAELFKLFAALVTLWTAFAKSPQVLSGDSAERALKKTAT